MTRSIRCLLPLALVVLLPACEKPAAPGSAAQESPAAAATAALAGTPAATKAAAPASASAADADADAAFVLTMAKVDAYYDAIGNIARASAKDPSIDDATAQDGNESAEQYAARLDADPKLKALVTSGGLSAREYAQVNDALVGGLMTAGALDSKALKTIPDGINPQWVDFVRAHKAEMDAKLAAIQAKAQAGG